MENYVKCADCKKDISLMEARSWGGTPLCEECAIKRAREVGKR